MTKPVLDHAVTLTVPAAVIWNGSSPVVEFREISMTALDAPFWEQTLAKGRIVAVRPLDTLPLPDGPLALVGAVHHIWRCGSTLVCRQFSALADCYALSEPYVFSNLIVGHPQPVEVLEARVRRLLGALQQALAPVATRLVIKWPGLLAQHARELAEALPEVPMVFLHRDPVEVLASIKREPLGTIRNLSAEYLGGANRQLADESPDTPEILAHMIAHNCRHAAAAPRLRHCDYNRLPLATPDAIAPFFGMALGADDRRAMRETANWHSKAGRGGAPFTSDSDLNQRAADSELRRLAEEVIAPALAEVRAKLEPV